MVAVNFKMLYHMKDKLQRNWPIRASCINKFHHRPAVFWTYLMGSTNLWCLFTVLAVQQSFCSGLLGAYLVKRSWIFMHDMLETTLRRWVENCITLYEFVYLFLFTFWYAKESHISMKWGVRPNWLFFDRDNLWHLRI